MADRTDYTDAVCRDEDPELFFPVGNTTPALLQAEEAKAVCRRCDLIEQCLQDHIWDQWGVYGGTTWLDRRRMLENPRFRSMVTAS